MEQEKIQEEIDNIENHKTEEIRTTKSNGGRVGPIIGSIIVILIILIGGIYYFKSIKSAMEKTNTDQGIEEIEIETSINVDKDNSEN